MKNVHKYINFMIMNRNESNQNLKGEYKMRERKNNMTFLVTLLLIVLSLVLVACSSDGSKNSENGVTTVTFWIGGGAAGDALKEAIKTFNEEHDDIQVEGTYAKSSSTSDDKLLTATAGGNPPDIAFFDRFKVSSWVEQDSLTDITEYAEKDDISKDDFYSFAWDEAHYNDKLYAIPLSTDSRLLYYNKDQFKEVWLDPNEPTKTIDDLEEVSMKLTKPKGNRFERIGFIPWYNQGQLFTWGLSFGGTFFDEETGKVVMEDARLEAFQELWQEVRPEVELIPTRGCSVPTFHGSAADLAGVASTLVNLLGRHMQVGRNDVSGTYLIALPHAVSGPSYTFLPYENVAAQLKSL